MVFTAKAADAPLDPNDYRGIKKYEIYGKDLIAPESGYRYMGADTNSYYNNVIKMLGYHINTLTIFQYILDAIGSKGKYGGWMIVRINKGKIPVICMVQDESILKNIFSQRRCGNTMESIITFQRTENTA